MRKFVDFNVCVSLRAVTANEKKSDLPLNSPNPLIALMSGAKDKVTPQQALMQTMAAVHAKVFSLLVVLILILWWYSNHMIDIEDF